MSAGKDPDFVSNVSTNYDLRDTEYVSEQLDFAEYAELNYPDEFSETWEDNISERYKSLVEAFGSVDQYVNHQDDGSLTVLIGRGDDLLVEIEAEEETRPDKSRFGFSSIVDSLSG